MTMVMDVRLVLSNRANKGNLRSGCNQGLVSQWYCMNGRRVLSRNTENTLCTFEMNLWGSMQKLSNYELYNMAKIQKIA